MCCLYVDNSSVSYSGWIDKIGANKTEKSTQAFYRGWDDEEESCHLCERPAGVCGAPPGDG